jgi:uncharacterized protein (TIRG00374 family)
MNATIKTALKIIIPLILTVLIVWYISGLFDFEKVKNKLQHADYSWVAITIVISLLAHLSRAYRWNLLIEPLGYKPPLGKTFLAVMVGYFGNIFVPRMGEVLRCVVLNRIDRVPFNSSLGTVVAERVIDFLCLLTLIGISLLLEFERFSALISKLFAAKEKTPGMMGNNNFIIVAGFIAIIFIIIFYFFRKAIFSSSFFMGLKKFAYGIWEGVISIKKMERKWSFILHTFIIWICYYFMTYLIFYSLPATADLGPMAGLVILIVGGLGMSAPTQGGIGAFHYLVAGALQLFYGLTEDDGVAYALLIHTSQLISVLVVGFISLIICFFLVRKFKLEDIISEPAK